MSELLIRKVKRGYIIKRDDGRHSHFATLQGCYHCLEFIHNKVLPHNPYFMKAIERLLDSEELEEFNVKRKKQHYINKRGAV
jgi:hypothetical protein